jgi:nucleoside-diphosphate-sugar epimerase
LAALVTGASGFLGGRLVEMLLEKGEAVTVLARQGATLDHLKGLALRIVRGSLTDRTALREALKGATEIYHCAAASTDWASDAVYQESNVDGTQVLLEASLALPGLRRFLHVSTTDVYGYPHTPGGEDAPLIDAGLPYNRTKRLAELAVWEAFRRRGLPVTLVRPATIYGPRGKAFVTDIAALLRDRLMLLIDGGRRRGGFIYVDDVAHAMIVAAGSDRTVGEAYNLCDGAGGTWREYVNGLADELRLKRPWLNLPYAAASVLARGMELPYRMAPTLSGRPLLTRHAVVLLGRDQEFPIAKARAHFRFRAEVSLAEGLHRSAEWLRSLEASPRA